MTLSRKLKFNKTMKNRNTIGGLGVPSLFSSKSLPKEVAQAAPLDNPQQYSSQCSEDNREAADTLRKLNIQTVTKQQSKNVSSSNPYNTTNRRVEKLNSVITVLALAGGFVPVVGQCVVVARALVLGMNKHNKNKELSYLSSDCLSYVSNIVKDLSDMNAFYSNNTVKAKGILINTSLYSALQKNLFQFLYFLIDSIDFTQTNLGPTQYLFWYSFLKQIDFSNKNYNKYIPPGTYRYSSSKCIPIELRQLLQNPNLDYKKVVNLNNNAKTMLERMGSVIKTTKSPPEKFGFCSEELIDTCRNHNDIIVRLIEFNMYKLINATYKNRITMYAKLQFDKSHENDFYQFIFFPNRSQPGGIEENEENKENEAPEEKKDFSEDVREKLIHNISDNGVKQEANIYLDFLFELKRIINELNFNIPKDWNTTTPRLNRLSKVAADYSGYNYTMAYFNTAITKYNELLRDYIIMTGNFASITSRYIIDSNLLSLDERKKVNDEIKEESIKYTEQIQQLRNSAQATSNGISSQADSETGLEQDASRIEQDASRIDTEGLGNFAGGTRQKQSKKYKSKRTNSKKKMISHN